MNVFTILNGSPGVERGGDWAAQGWVMLAQANDAVGFNLGATFARAELFGKAIVILLLLFSLLAWTVMIGKYLDLSRWRQMNLAFQAKIKQSLALLETNISPGMRQSGPYARLLFEAVQAARQYRADGEARVRMGLIENALQRAVAEECVRYETKMVVLGSLVSGAPFIGLLGTVWGVMVAFSAMGMSGGAATVQSMAPGVASALLATVSGLLVAIPSVFGYNFLLTHVKMMITEIENFASWLADRMELEIEASRMPPEEPDAGQPAVAPTPPPAPVPATPVRPAAPVSPPALPPVARPAVAATKIPPAPPPAPVPPPVTPVGPLPPGDPAVAAAERYLRLDVSEDGQP
jgi:biopolymer transport protein TolQ